MTWKFTKGEHGLSCIQPYVNWTPEKQASVLGWEDPVPSPGGSTGEPGGSYRQREVTHCPKNPISSTRAVLPASLFAVMVSGKNLPRQPFVWKELDIWKVWGWVTGPELQLGMGAASYIQCLPITPSKVSYTEQIPTENQWLRNDCWSVISNSDLNIIPNSSDLKIHRCYIKGLSLVDLINSIWSNNWTDFIVVLKLYTKVKVRYFQIRSKGSEAVSFWCKCPIAASAFTHRAGVFPAFPPLPLVPRQVQPQPTRNHFYHFVSVPLHPLLGGYEHIYVFVGT